MVSKSLLSRPLGRCVGLDVHLDFIEIAICEEGKVWSAGRVPSTPEGIGTLAGSLLATDRVALEVTGSSWEIVRLLEPHVSKIIVVSPGDTGISQARAKTDRLDARTLARLLWTGELEAVWVPPEWTWRMRRRLSRRSQLVSARSRAKNEIHAVLMRRLKGRPPVSDLFGVKGREWLRGLQLPLVEAETVRAGLRHIEFLDTEIEQVERLICQEALKSPTGQAAVDRPGRQRDLRGGVPGRGRRHPAVQGLSARSSPISALTRASTSQAQHPRAAGGSQNRAHPKRAGRWSRPPARSPGSPARCTPSTSASEPAKATTPRSSPSRASSPRCSGACSPANEDYAHQQPSLTAQKLRRLEVRAGAPTVEGKPTGVWATRERMRHAEKQLAAQAEASYKRSIADWQAASPKNEKVGASVTAGRA